MSTASLEGLTPAPVRRVLHTIMDIRLSMPASEKTKARLRADFAHSMGLDLSEDDRAEMIRARHS